MTRAAIPLPLAIITLFGCLATPPSEPPRPDRNRSVDTITITRPAARPATDTATDIATAESTPPDPRPVMVCLATGQNVQVHVSVAGDTLVGPRRVPLVDIGPLLGFVGDYAAAKGWFVHDQSITFDGRTFAKAGRPAAHDCHSIRIVGDFDGVNVFADADAISPLRVIYVPVQPGVFQTYQSTA